MDSETLKIFKALYETISLAGFETKVRVPIRLEELYVPLDAMIDLRTVPCKEAVGCGDEAVSRMGSEESREVPLARASKTPNIAYMQSFYSLLIYPSQYCNAT